MMQVNSIAGLRRGFTGAVAVVVMVTLTVTQVAASELTEQLAARAEVKRAVTALLGTDFDLAVDYRVVDPCPHSRECPPAPCPRL